MRGVPMTKVTSVSQDNGFAYYVDGITSSGVGWSAMLGPEGQEPVYEIPLREIQAVVSRVPLTSFSPTTLESKIHDTAWLQEKVLAHERVIRRVFTDHTIIPMKFGTLFETEEGVQAMLAEHYAEFIALLAKLDGKEEWGVKIFADRERLRGEIEQQDPAIKAKSGAIALKSTGAAYLLQQKLKEQIAARVDQVLADSSQYAYTRLLDLAVEGQVLNLLRPELTGRLEEMILHAAFLVQREHTLLFLADAENLKSEHPWWQVECTGPWAPYNFLAAHEEMQSV
jgi:hypothetical protein